MPDTVEIIEGIWQAHTEQIEGLKAARIWEPDAIDRKLLPMATLYFLLPEGRDVETGPGEDVSYAYEVSLYVALSDWKSAQQQMRTMAFRLVENFRQHRSDYDNHLGADIFARTLRRRVPPTPGEDDSYLRGSWEMTLTVTEA